MTENAKYKKLIEKKGYKVTYYRDLQTYIITLSNGNTVDTGKNLENFYNEYCN